MFVYHEQHPMQYIGVVAVCYALVAALWTVRMKRPRRGVSRMLEVLAVILVALALACPLGGMLWHFHDMQAGFFPNFWLRKLLGGFVDGLMIGPRLIFYSFPYNLIRSDSWLSCHKLSKFFFPSADEPTPKVTLNDR